MKKQQTILLSALVLAIVILLTYSYFSNIGPKSAASKTSVINVPLHYHFKNEKAKELSVSAFRLREEGSLPEAIVLYRQAIALEHDNPKLFFDLSECYTRKKELPKALSCMDTAILLDPSNPVFYSNRGLYYYKNDEDDAAIADLQKAIALDGQSYVYYANLALVYYAANRQGQACEALSQAKMLGLNTEALSGQMELKQLQTLCK